MATLKKSYRIGEASEALSCSPKTIYRLINDGSLQAFRLRDKGSLRIRASEIERFIRHRIQAYQAEEEDFLGQIRTNGDRSI